MKQLLLLIIFSIRLITATAQPDSMVIKKASWLVGTWKGMNNQSAFYETWRIQDDSLVNYTIEFKNDDTIVTRQTSLRHKGKSIVFGKKGDWQLKRMTRNEIVLENDASKYSNRIIYLHLANDHWFTILEHPGSTMYFDMEKVTELDLVIDRFIRNKQTK